MTTGDSSSVLEQLVTVFTADTSELESAFTKAAQKAQAEGAKIGQGLAVGLKSGITGATSEVDRVGAQIDKGRQSLSLLRAEQASGIATSAQYNSALKAQQDTLRGMVAQTQKGSDAYRALVGELAGVTQELDRVSAAGQKSGGFLSGITGGLAAGAQGVGLGGFVDLIQQLQQGLSGLAGGGEEAEASFQGVGDSVNSAAEHIGGFIDARKEEDAVTREANINQAAAAAAFTLTAAAATFLATSLVASFNAAADFEQAMNTAASTTEATADELERLKDLALSSEIGKLGVNGTQAAGAIAELGGAGLTTTQILEGALQPTLNLARAVGSEVATAAEVAAASMKAFGVEAAELPRVTDVITTAVNGTSVKMEDFSQALAQGGTVAKQSGLDFAQFTAAISLMTDKAISASDAGTSLKTFLQALTPNTKEAKAAMDDLKIKVFDAAGEFRPFADVIEDLRVAFQKLTPEQRAVTGETLFGADGIRAFNILVEQGAEGINARTQQLVKMGATDAAAATQLQGVRAEQELFNTAVQNFKIEIGEGFLASGAKFINFFTEALEKVRDLNRAMGETPKEIRTALTITADDDLTTMILKFVGGAVQATKEVVGIPTAGLATQEDIAKLAAKYAGAGDPVKATALRNDLVRVGALPELDGAASRQQYEAVLKNFAHYQRMWQNLIEAGSKGIVDALTPGNNAAQLNKAFGIGLPSYAPPASDLKDGQKQFSYAFISGLGEVLKNDPRVASDCAIIAFEILKQLGTAVKGTAVQNSWVPTLEKNAKAAGFTEVGIGDVKPGDLVIFKTGNGIKYGAGSNMHAGVAAGYQDGKLMVTDNPGTQADGRDGVTRTRNIGGDAQNATFYRAPNSPWAGSGAPAEPIIPELSGAQLLKQARDILKKLETKDPDALVVAKASLKTFEDSGDRAKAALEIVRGELKKTQKEVSEFGQGFDKLKKQMGTAESYNRLNDDAAAYAKTLEGISAAALKAAAAEKAKYGETKKYDALFNLGGDAAGKARQQREAISREAEKADKEQEAREKKAAALSAQVAEAARKGDVTLAKQREATLAQMRENDLRAAGENAAAKLAVEQRYAAKQEAAAKAVADLEYRNAMRSAAQGGAQNRVQRETEAANDKRLAYLKAESDAQERVGNARKSADDAAKKSAEELAAENLKLTEAMEKRTAEIRAQGAKVNEAVRSNNIAAAREELTQLEAMRQKDLAGAEDNAAERYRIERQYASQIYNAKKAVLDKEKADRDADIKNSDLPARVKREQLATSAATYTNGLNAAKAVQDKLLSEADDAMSRAAAGWNVNLAKQMGEGVVKGLQDKRADEALDQKAGEWNATLAKNITDGLVQGIRDKRADDALSERAAAWNAALGVTLGENAIKELTEQQRVLLEIQANGNDNIAAEALKAADELTGKGLYGEALDVLGGALERVFDSAQGGEDAGNSINTLTQAINDLTDAKARALAQARQEQAANLAVTPGIDANPARNPGTMLDALGRPMDGTSEARRTRAPVTEDPGIAARDAGAADREKAWEGVMRAERVDAYRESLKSLDLQQLETAKSAAILATDTERYGYIVAEIESKKTAQKADQATADEWRQQAAALEALDEQLAPVAVNLQGVFDRLGSGAETAGDARVELAALRSQLEGIGTEAAQNLITVIDEAVRGFDEMGGASATVTAALAKLRGETEQPYDTLIDSLEKMKTKPGAAVLEINQLIAMLQRLNEEAAKTEGLNKLSEGFQKLSTGLSSVFKAFGATGLGEIADGLGSIGTAALQVPGALDKMRDSWAAFKKGPDAGSLGGLLGSLGGVVGIAGAVIGAVGSIGDALLKNNPAVKAQVKAWLELADAERAAMGQRMVGGRNGFLNPFYDALKADSEALTTKANAGFWQRLGWSLFGGAPETLSKSASESLQKASSIFNEFGASLYNDLSSALMDAINQGDFSKINDVLKVQLDKFVQKAAIDALIAKSNLAPLIEELATTSASGGDTSSIMARIRAEESRIAGQVEAIAPSLPGYGAGAPTAADPAAGGSLFGAAGGTQFGIPRIEVSLPEIATRSLTDFAAVVPTFNAASVRLLEAANLIVAAHGRGGPPPLSGLGGLT